MEDIVSQTKSEYIRSKERLLKLLNLTPADKLSWSPSPAARTPIQLAAHSAMAVDGILSMLNGQGTGEGTVTEIDAYLRKEEKQYDTVEKVVELLDKNSAAYLAYLDTLTPEQLASTTKGFFGSTFPVSEAITFAAFHMRGHIAQLEYVQTIWGDHDWYM
jgi:hypothetical protein